MKTEDRDRYGDKEGGVRMEGTHTYFLAIYKCLLFSKAFNASPILQRRRSSVSPSCYELTLPSFLLSPFYFLASRCSFLPFPLSPFSSHFPSSLCHTSTRASNRTLALITWSNTSCIVPGRGSTSFSLIFLLFLPVISTSLYVANQTHVVIVVWMWHDEERRRQWHWKEARTRGGNGGYYTMESSGVERRRRGGEMRREEEGQAARRNAMI